MADHKSFLDMSDEEMMKVQPSSFVIEEPQDQTKSDDTQVDEQQVDTTNQDDVIDPNKDDENVENQGEKVVSDPEKSDDESNTSDENGKDEENKAAQTQKPVVDSSKTVDNADKSSPEAIDYKAAYEKLTAPFKANGREVQVKSVEDALQLMQMGANYNKKMAGLKPNLKLMKLLENNGLLDEGKLNFLIDLEKRNPEAISKLVKDSGIDPLDISGETADKYKPTSYKVDERELQLDDVLGDLRDSPAYDRTMEVVTSEWDGASRQVIAETPQVLKVINDHMNNGIYDIIDAELQSEKMLGRLNGLSDLQAYQKVGDAINARGGFNHLNKQDEKPVAKAVVTAPVKPNKPTEDELREKRRAASPTKSGAAKVDSKQDFNPLAMSDEEFSKQVQAKYL